MTEAVSSAEESFNYEWVEIIEPRKREHMYANLKTGQCLWDPPEDVPVKPTHENQWWELYDTNTRRYYYYNATSQQTIWRKPKDGDIVALAKLQMLKAKETQKLSKDYSSAMPSTQSSESKVSSSVPQTGHSFKSSTSDQSPPKSAKFSKDVSLEIADANQVDDGTCKSTDSKPHLQSHSHKANSAPGLKLYENLTISLSSEKDPQNRSDRSSSSVHVKSQGDSPSDGFSKANNVMQRDGKLALDGASSGEANPTREPAYYGESPTTSNLAVTVVSVSRTRKDSGLPAVGSGPESSIETRREEKSLVPSGMLQKSASMRHAGFSYALDVDEKFKFNSLRVDRSRSNTATAGNNVVREGSLKRAPPKPPRSTVHFDAAKVPKESPASGNSVNCDTVAHKAVNSSDIHEKVFSLGKELAEPSRAEFNYVASNQPPTPISSQQPTTPTSAPQQPPTPTSPLHQPPIPISPQQPPTPISPQQPPTPTSHQQPPTPTSPQQLSVFASPEDGKPTWKISASRSPTLRSRTIERPARVPPLAPESTPTTAPSPPPPPPTPPVSSPRRILPQPGHVRQASSSIPEKKASMYDNLGGSNGDAEIEPMSVSPSVDSSLSSQGLDKGSSDSSGSCSPSGTLVRNGQPSPYDDHYSTIKSRSSSSVVSFASGSISSPDRVLSSLDHERVKKMASSPHAASHPTKRSPLQRMKSDSSELEKRAKLAGGAGGFRPVSMMDIAGSRKPSLRQPLGSDSDMPEQMPLSTHRRGILRRRMSIHSMLSWSKTPIKKPMVLTREKQLKKSAVEMFKLVLQYMGDRASKRSPNNIAVEVTTKGWTTAALRDEIFIQLCKQTTGNEKVLSLQRGWELMTACLSLFPPSNKFHSYLEGYIYRHLEPDEDPPGVPVSQYAKHCYKQLERICQSGAKRGNRKPTTDDIEAAKDAVFNPSMFGNTFDDIMEMQESRFPDNRLPWILTTLTEAVLMESGLTTEGIFRVPGDIDEVNSLKMAMDKWQMPTGLKDPHVPASLLKLWFREAYEPLIPQRFYDTCIHNCDSATVSLGVVDQLPEINRLIFSYLIRFLQAFMIPSNVARTKMDDNNLAMVWAPNCLRCPSNDPREIFENTRREMTFLRTVMKSLDTSFLQGIV